MRAQRGGTGGGGGGGAAEIDRCTPPPRDPTGYTSSLACPSGLSYSYHFTGAAAELAVPADCGLPPPPEGEEPPPERAACFFRVDACGAQGSAWGGLGGFVSSTISAAPGSTLYVYVGGIGNTFNGGGSGAPSSAGGVATVGALYNGGGATDVRTESGGGTGSAGLESRLVVAGGGGAGGNCDPICQGGNGGGFTGGSGRYVNTNPSTQPNGAGGAQDAGGACGSGFGPGAAAVAAASGALGIGGANSGGGAGGGGWYGGGAGWGGGGGGSSYSAPGTTSLATITQGDARCKGNGALYLTPLDITALPEGGLEAPPSPTAEPSSKPTHWPTRKRPTKKPKAVRPTYPHK